MYLLLKEPGQVLRADILKDRLLDEFGLKMPQQLINNCIRILEKQREVVRLPHGAGYKVAETKFNIDSFEKTRQMLYEHKGWTAGNRAAIPGQWWEKLIAI